MNKPKYIISSCILLICLMAVVPARAQWERGVSDTTQLPRWEPHLSVHTGFMGTNYGDNRLFSSVAPSLTFRPNSRWTVNAGFRITTDMGLNPHFSSSSSTRSLAPYRREYNGGTGLASVYAAAQYQVNDRLWLAASVYHLTGTYAPICAFSNGNVLDVSATAVSAAASYRLKDDSFLHFAISYIRDEYGTLPYMWHDAWMHGSYGSWGMYGAPCSHLGFGGMWY